MDKWLRWSLSTYSLNLQHGFLIKPIFKITIALHFLIAHLWKSFHSCSYCESSPSATFFPQIFFSFFLRKGRFRIWSPSYVLLKWTRQSIFNLHLERRVVQHGPLKLLQIEFQIKWSKMPFWSLGLSFFANPAQIFPPGLRQGREACLPGLISFVTVSKF